MPQQMNVDENENLIKREDDIENKINSISTSINNNVYTHKYSMDIRSKKYLNNYNLYNLYPLFNTYTKHYYPYEHSNFILSVYPIGSILVSINCNRNCGYIRSILGSMEYFYHSEHLPANNAIKRYKLLKYTYQSFIQDQVENTSLDIGMKQITVQSKEDSFNIFKNITAFFTKKKKRRKTGYNENSVASSVSSGTRSKDFKKLIEMNKQKFLNYYINFIELDDSEKENIKGIESMFLDEEYIVDVYVDECAEVGNIFENNEISSKIESVGLKEQNKNNKLSSKENKNPDWDKKIIKQSLGSLLSKEEFVLIKHNNSSSLPLINSILAMKRKDDMKMRFEILKEFFTTEFNYFKHLNNFNVNFLKVYLEQRTSKSDADGLLKKTMFNNIFGHFLDVIKSEQIFFNFLLNSFGIMVAEVRNKYMDKEDERIIEEILALKFEQRRKEVYEENKSTSVDNVILNVFNAFLQNIKYFKSYKYFCTTYSHSLEIIKQNLKHKYIKNIFSNENVIPEIESYFILPIQRIIRYKMYLEGLYKNSVDNRDIMVEGIRVVSEFIQVLNNDRERYEMGRLAFMIQGKVKNCPSSILSKSRGYVSQIAANGLSLFLYTDLLLVVERKGNCLNIFQDDKDTTFTFIKFSDLRNTRIYIKNKNTIKLTIVEENTEKKFYKIPGSIVVKSDTTVMESVILEVKELRDFVSTYNRLKNNCITLKSNIAVYNDDEIYYHLHKGGEKIIKEAKGFTSEEKKRVKIYFKKFNNNLIQKLENINIHETFFRNKEDGIVVQNILVPKDFRKKGTSFMKRYLEEFCTARKTIDNKECYIKIEVYSGENVEITFITNLDIKIEKIILTHEEYYKEFRTIVKSCLKLVSLVQPLSVDKLEEYGEYLNVFYEEKVSKKYEKLSFSIPIPIMNEIVYNLCCELAEEGWGWNKSYREKMMEEIKNIKTMDLYGVEVEGELRNLYTKKKLRGVEWILKLKVVFYYILCNVYNIFSFKDIIYLYLTGSTEIVNSLKLKGDKKMLAEGFLKLIGKFYAVFDYEIAIVMWKILLTEKVIGNDEEWLKEWVKYVIEQYK